MIKLAESEYKLIQLLQDIFIPNKYPGYELLYWQKHVVPEKFSNHFIYVFTDTLTKGIVVRLAKLACSSHIFFPHHPHDQDSKAYFKPPAQALKFSQYSLLLLSWLLRSKLNSSKYFTAFDLQADLLGDELLLYFVAQRLQQLTLYQALMNSMAFNRNRLCWLGMFDILCNDDLNFQQQVRSEQLALLFKSEWLFQLMKKSCYDSWYAIEIKKQSISDVNKLKAIALSQQQILTSLFALSNENKQAKPIDFIFQLAAALLKHKPNVQNWTCGLAEQLSVQARIAAGRARLSLFYALESFYQCIESARLVRFFDQDYGYSQSLLKLWNYYGEHGRKHAAYMMNQLHKACI